MHASVFATLTRLSLSFVLHLPSVGLNACLSVSPPFFLSCSPISGLVGERSSTPGVSSSSCSLRHASMGGGGFPAGRASGSEMKDCSRV
ncbi:hypothetical protein BKA80DRAFT_56484 [Phyllosticta citrichinensis]